MNKTDAELLRRAAEIVQWSVDVQPTVTEAQLMEARAIKAALRRAAPRDDTLEAAAQIVLRRTASASGGMPARRSSSSRTTPGIRRAITVILGEQIAALIRAEKGKP